MVKIVTNHHYVEWFLLETWYLCCPGCLGSGGVSTSRYLPEGLELQLCGWVPVGAEEVGFGLLDLPPLA